MSRFLTHCLQSCPNLQTIQDFLKVEGRAPKASLKLCFTPFGHFNQNPLLLVELVKSSRGHKKATIMRSCRHPKKTFDSVADNQFSNTDIFSLPDDVGMQLNLSSYIIEFAGVSNYSQVPQ